MNKKAVIITSSDTASRGERIDVSGTRAVEILKDAGYTIAAKIILPDTQERLAAAMKTIADRHQADLIVTTGGTGFSRRDITPEATIEVCERLCPGIPEAIRAYSMTITKRAMLSRAAAGIRYKTLIVNLPGSPKAVEEALEYILPELEHGLMILSGEARDCARK
ncbi:MAG: MogA/MoaB family molybdenum cofactor biosynthesis protein [Eubacteriaceae bacterium]|jgi:molybdopterin adenylyltransferase